VANEALLAAVGHAVSGVLVVEWAWEQIPRRGGDGTQAFPRSFRNSARRGQRRSPSTPPKMSGRSIQMSYTGAHNGVVFPLRGSADSAMQATDEGIFPMGTHRRILHDVTPTRTVPVQGLAGALRADPPIRVARGILILALAVGGLGAGAAASAGLSGADHARSHQPTGNIHLTARSKPWIY